MAQGPGASLLGNDMLNRAQLAPPRPKRASSMWSSEALMLGHLQPAAIQLPSQCPALL